MKPKRIISYLFAILFFTIPLAFFPYTSELFEFNKMIVVYSISVLVAFFWFYRIIDEKKIFFKRTILDIPILIFLTSQIISTIISVDVRTSLLGYYSRFNGGLFSLLSYSFLYWAYVSNMEKSDVFTSIKAIFISTLLSSYYGILEHFGIDKNIWIQDVQNRVFSTFGQPNWLAAWLVAVIPISQMFILKNYNVLSIKEDLKNKKSIKISKIVVYLILATFFLTLLYTKSRSGIIGFVVAEIIFWGFTSLSNIKNRAKIKEFFKLFSTINILFLVLISLTGTPWTPSLGSLIQKINNNSAASNSVEVNPKATMPALEVGGSSSSEIRKIVWKGALDIWKNYPLFGSGVETFAFSYYQFRPKEHNLLSEWDFLYNKAHNEYLNYMATSGSVGITAYLIIILFSIIQILRLKQKYSYENKPSSLLSKIISVDSWQVAILSGYVSILVTNFFGFSVVPINLLFFLFPAFIISLENDGIETQVNNTRRTETTNTQKSSITLAGITSLLLLYLIARYWYADILYNRADSSLTSGNLINSVNEINSAIKLSPHEAIYYDKLASALSNIALAYNNQENHDSAEKYSENAIKTILLAEKMSPNNLNIIRNKAKLAIQLSEIDPVYILEGKKALLRGIELAPTDAKLYYNLSLVYYRIGDNPDTIQTLEKTITLKSNYKEARYAYAIILSENGEKDKAREQLNYILQNLDPSDSNVKNALEEI